MMMSASATAYWPGAVAVASEIHGEKGECPGLEQHNWAFKKEDPFPKWEV